MSRAMFCSISGIAPEAPVVSTKSGHIFEQSVVEKYIESTGKCPVTGEPLEVSDLLPVKASTAVKPRPVAATSQHFPNSGSSVCVQARTGRDGQAQATGRASKGR